MTTITLNRATVEQALEALELVTDLTNHDDEIYEAITALRTALAQQAEAWVCPESPEHRYTKPGHCEDCGKTLVLAQQAEPVALKHRHEWFRTGGMEPGQFRCIHCGVWAKETAHD